MARTPILEDWERQKLHDLRNGLIVGYSAEDREKFLTDVLARLYEVIESELDRIERAATYTRFVPEKGRCTDGP